MTGAEAVDLLHLTVAAGEDVTGVRHVAGRAAAALQLDRPDATRVATAVSEIARIGARHGPTTVTVGVRHAGVGTPPSLEIGFAFTGTAWTRRPGDPVPAALVAAQRLVDRLDVTDGGVTIVKTLPADPTGEELADLRHTLLTDRPGDLRSVLQGQNTELVAALTTLRDREAELVRLNLELEQTNRGVVALYAELEQRSDDIRTAQRAVFQELERALRPLPPLVPGLELDVRYLPAQVNSPTGGDLYDWLVLPDGTVHVCVVDVQGHGVASTRDALLITHTVRTLVQEGHDLDHVLRHADSLLQLPGRNVFATCLLVRLDPRTGELHLAGAGHPPALLQPTVGAVRYLEAPGRSFGYPGAGNTTTTTTTLGPGDVVLLYTDGLVEIRQDILEGLDTLEAAAVKGAGMELPQLLDTVLAACTLGDPLRDDTLLLALRWRRPGDPQTSREALGVSLPSTVDAPGMARRYLLERTGGLPTPVVEDALLMTSELVGNAVRHGGPPILLTVAVPDAAGAGDTRIRVAVRDDGATIAEGPRVRPEHTQRSGRGLFIVEALARTWGVIETPAGDGPPGKTIWFEV